MMRIAAASLLLTILVGSAAPTGAQSVERIELRQSGETSLDIQVNRQGESRYEDSGYDPSQRRRGTFRVSAQQYDDLVARLAVYRRESVPMNDDSLRALMRQTCPAGVDFVTDSGGIWVHWIGPGTNEHYFADLGCDRERNARRNEDLRSILRSLPVPADS
jgi:hypothetical protein